MKTDTVELDVTELFGHCQIARLRDHAQAGISVPRVLSKIGLEEAPEQPSRLLSKAGEEPTFSDR